MLSQVAEMIPGVADFVLLVVIVMHVVNAPFTKVEESFNVQAMHDLLFHGSDLAKYDHHDFPGVVPRTFIGAATVATVSAPVVYPMHYLLGFHKLSALFAVRLALGFLAWLCTLRLRIAARRVFGHLPATCFALLTACQFHLPFYMSRPLPNTFALCLVTLAHAHWLDGTQLWLTPALLTVTAVVFRCDMVLLTGVVCLHLLLTRRMGFVALAATGVATGALSLAGTVLFDSMFWGRWLWPEGEVLWFNTVLNKSKEWGVMPFHWYFTSALPRALLAALPLAICAGYTERRLRGHLAAVGAFVLLYSFLGHKELRFLLPALPILNVAAGCCLARLWLNRHKSWSRRGLALAAVAGVGASAAATVIFSVASHHNYPGGWALVQAHALHAEPNVSRPNGVWRMHVCTLPAMTGVTRFGEMSRGWTYNKAQNVGGKEVSLHEFLAVNVFDLVLAATTDVEGHLPKGYAERAATDGFSRLRLHKSLVSLLSRAATLKPPLEVVLEPQVVLLQRVERTPS